MAREQLQTLTEPMFYILLSLTTPMHGYEIMQTVASISRQRVKIGAGTLYALLTRFEKEKIIERVAEDGRRKIYRITPKGREILDNGYAWLKDTLAAYDRFLSERGEPS